MPPAPRSPDGTDHDGAEPRGPAPIGRARERAQLDEVLTWSVDVCPQVVTLRGDPGIGKTELLTYAATRAAETGFRVVWVRGNEADREFPYGAMPMLVGPLTAEATDLTEVQLQTLATAMNTGSALSDDRVGVAAATRAALTSAAATRPLLLAIDDLQTLDDPTVDVVFRAVRNLAGPIAVVMTARSDEFVASPLRAQLDGFRTISVGGLDMAAARLLTRHRGDLSEAMWAATGGNPLALLEMSEALDLPDSDRPVDLPARLVRAYARRLVELPTATQSALLLLAVAGRAVDALDDALAAAKLRRSDFDPAENDGLVVEDGDVRFRHPLIRSAVNLSVDPAARRRAHRAMADAYAERPGSGAVERRAFHLDHATSGRDAAVADEVADAARAARSRYRHVAASEFFERAAELTPTGDLRTRRLIEAAVEGQAAGRLDAVGPLLTKAIDEAANDELRIAAEHLQCRVRIWSGRPRDARDQLIDLANRCEQSSPALSAVMRAQAAVVSIAIGQQSSAIRMVARAEELTRGVPAENNIDVLVAVAVSMAVNGDVGKAREALAQCAPHLPACDPLSINQLLVQAALTYALLEEYEPARRWLELAQLRAHAAQATGLLPFQLTWLSLVCFLVGDWQSASAHGRAAVEFAEATGWATELPHCLVSLATVEVGRGEAVAARQHLDRAVRVAAAQDVTELFIAHRARLTGQLALGEARFAEAAELLQAAGDAAVAQGLGDTVLFGWAADLTEALLLDGKPDRARLAHRVVIAEAERTGRPTALAVEARCRGLLAAGLDAGRSAFTEALRHHRDAPRPFEDARTHLCFGEFLRHHRRHAEAREHLDAALSTFDRLGAVAWSRRAAHLTVPSPRSAVNAAEVLTPRELEVAREVAKGGTNAQVARTLGIEAKTVEYHLRNVYHKLDVRGRVQMAALVRGSGTE